MVVILHQSDRDREREMMEKMKSECDVLGRCSWSKTHWSMRDVLVMYKCGRCTAASASRCEVLGSHELDTAVSGSC